MSPRLAALGLVCAISAGCAQARWEEYAAAHDCRVIGTIGRTVATGYTSTVLSDGRVGSALTTTVTRGKTGYRCNDGQEHWR
jgi:hypothetical protein